MWAESDLESSRARFIGDRPYRRHPPHHLLRGPEVTFTPQSERFVPQSQHIPRAGKSYCGAGPSAARAKRAHLGLLGLTHARAHLETASQEGDALATRRLQQSGARPEPSKRHLVWEARHLSLVRALFRHWAESMTTVNHEQIVWTSPRASSLRNAVPPWEGFDCEPTRHSARRAEGTLRCPAGRRAPFGAQVWTSAYRSGGKTGVTSTGATAGSMPAWAPLSLSE